jgi:hypothetical protein
MALERPDAEDGVRAAIDQGSDDLVQVAGIVLEVGVEDRGEVSPRVRQGGPNGLPLAPVLRMLEDADRRRPAVAL